MTSITIATDETFAQEALGADKPVVVSFWSPHDRDSVVMAPIVDEIAAEKPGLKIVKLNAQDNLATAEMFGLWKTPMLLVMNNGEILGHWETLHKDRLSQFIDKMLSEPCRGLTIEQYRERSVELFRQTVNVNIQFDRWKNILACGGKIAGGLTLAFTIAAAGFSSFGLVTAAFNAVRGVSIFRNKDGVPDLYASRPGRIFSAISNATTLTASGLLLAVASAGGRATVAAAILGIGMFFSGIRGLTKDASHLIGLNRLSASQQSPATENTPPAAPPAP